MTSSVYINAGDVATRVGVLSKLPLTVRKYVLHPLAHPCKYSVIPDEDDASAPPLIPVLA